MSMHRTYNPLSGDPDYNLRPITGRTVTRRLDALLTRFGCKPVKPVVYGVPPLRRGDCPGQLSLPVKPYHYPPYHS